MTINEYQELAMTTLNPELSKREILITQLSHQQNWEYPKVCVNLQTDVR